MLNYQLNARRGFQPRRCGSPDAIPPEEVLRHHRSAPGRHGRQAHAPLSLCTSILNFISMDKEFSRAKKNVFFLKKLFSGSG